MAPLRRRVRWAISDGVTRTDPSRRPEPIPLQIVTGFLGAGKTTLLNRLLASPLMADSVVIVNEFGETGLDHLLMQGVEDGMILMESGCLCCTIRGDLVNTLEDLLRRRDNGRITPFGRVVIETTGIADPAPILEAALNHPYLSLRYELDGVVTVIDAVNGLETLAAHEEALRQAAVADRIVLTKTDMPDGAARAPELRALLAALNPGASVLEAAAGEAEPSAVIGLGLFDIAAKPREVDAWLAIESLGSGAAQHRRGDGAHDANRHGDIAAVLLTAERPVRSQTLDLFWSLLRTTHGAKLLRLKGIVDVAEHPDAPLVMHAARQVMHPPVALPGWPSEDRRTRIVVFTKGLDPVVVKQLWAAFTGEAAVHHG